MARFITFHPLEPAARWFECWPLSCLPTPLSPCKLYLSKRLFPFIKPSVPVSRTKSALLKTRTMLSYVVVFCPFFWPKLLLLMVLGLIIKLNKTKENPLLSQRPSFVCRHSLQLKSYSIELPLTYEYTYLIQIYAFVKFCGTSGWSWGSVNARQCSIIELCPQHFVCPPFLSFLLCVLRQDINKLLRLASN